MKPALEISIEKETDRAVVSLKGEIGIETCADFKKCLQDLYENNYKEIVLNMGDVTLITSMGIAVIVHIHNYLKAGGNSLKLLVPYNHIYEILALAGVPKIIEVVEIPTD